MIRSSLRPAGRRLLVLAIAALIPALAGCEAGNNAPTQEWHQPTDGTGVVLNDISIRNVFVLGAPIGSTIGVGSSARSGRSTPASGGRPVTALMIAAATLLRRPSASPDANEESTP